MQPFRWKISIQPSRHHDVTDQLLSIVQGLAKIEDALAVLISFGCYGSNLELTVMSYRMYRAFTTTLNKESTGEPK